jgi:hypothetical protein
MSTSSSNQTKSTSKFCKVCYDAGKEYTTHYVRDSIGGTVVCPTLLNRKCKYCKIAGHTISRCPALKGKYNNSYKAPAKQTQAKQTQAPAEQTQAPAKQTQAPAKQTWEARVNQLRESPPPPPERKAPAKQAPTPAKQAPAKQAPAKQAPAKQAPAKQAPAPSQRAPPPDRKAPAKQAPAKQAPVPATKIKNSGKNYFNSLSDIMEEEANPLAVGANTLAVGFKKTEPFAQRDAKRDADLNENFPALSLRPSQFDSGKIIRPTPNKLNVWARIAAQEPVQQAEPAQAEPAQAEQTQEPVQQAEPIQQAQPAQEPTQAEPAQEPVQQAEPVQAKEPVYESDSDSDSEDESEVEVKKKFISWADME